MARAASFAQHYIECENCEENPAQYFCKTCAGHLCETCKTEHEKKKITQNHEIFHLSSDKGEGMELLYCSEHTTKKLDCYCSPCQKPICIKCLMETHNGHTVENLATVYNRIKKKLEKEKDEIETSLLPKYKSLLSKENEKKSAISKRTAEVQKQIEDHTENVINKILLIKERRVQDLRRKEQRVQSLVEKAKLDLEARIDNLEKITTQITSNLGANPGITFFKTIDENKLTNMRKLPTNIEYKLDNFKGDINTIPQEKMFGNWPEFAILKPEDFKDQRRAKQVKGKNDKGKGGFSWEKRERVIKSPSSFDYGGCFSADNACSFDYGAPISSDKKVTKYASSFAYDGWKNDAVNNGDYGNPYYGDN